MSANTLMAYGRDLKRMARYMADELGIEQPTEFDRPSLHEYVAHLHDEGLQPRSIARHLSTLRSYCAYLVERGVMADNPATALDMPRLANGPHTMSVSYSTGGGVGAGVGVRTDLSKIPSWGRPPKRLLKAGRT